jgi:NhaP-type Na+/H+ or K+/H+ antiporter
VFSGLYFTELGVLGLGNSYDVKDALVIFFRMSLGGTVVGVAYAVLLSCYLYLLDRRLGSEDTVLQIAATLTVAYLTFFTSEIICKMSGIIAVVVCGVLTRAIAVSFIDLRLMESFWSLVEHLLNTVVFALGGWGLRGQIVASPDREWDALDWGHMFALYITLNVIRYLMLFCCYPLLARNGLGTNWQETFFSSFAGLRGAIGITLALGLDAFVRSNTDDPKNLAETSKVFGMFGGVAFSHNCAQRHSGWSLTEYFGFV